MLSTRDTTCVSDQRMQDVFQKIVNGRKSWKTLKGQSEPVWPPNLEAALIDGTYQSNATLRFDTICWYNLRSKKLPAQRLKRDKVAW
jgi:hypothetical protein